MRPARHLAALSLSMCIGTVPAVPQGNYVDYYPLQVGNRWVYDGTRAGLPASYRHEVLVSGKVDGDYYIVSEIYAPASSDVVDQPLLIQQSTHGDLICLDCGGAFISASATVGDCWSGDPGITYCLIADNYVAIVGDDVYPYSIIIRERSESENGIVDRIYARSVGMVEERTYALNAEKQEYRLIRREMLREAVSTQPTP